MNYAYNKLTGFKKMEQKVLIKKRHRLQRQGEHQLILWKWSNTKCADKMKEKVGFPTWYK